MHLYIVSIISIIVCSGNIWNVDGFGHKSSVLMGIEDLMHGGTRFYKCRRQFLVVWQIIWWSEQVSTISHE